MRNTYIAVIVLVVLAVGGILVFGMGKKAEAPIEPIMPPTPSPLPLPTPSPVACTMDAKLCPDGSYVGRSGPNCEFTECPTAVNTNSAVKEFTISGQNYSFTPNIITVKKGDKVKITFKNASGFHDFKIDEFGVASKKMQGPYQEVLQFTADKTGIFQYYCSVGTHRAMGMWGTLKVE